MVYFFHVCLLHVHMMSVVRGGGKYYQIPTEGGMVLSIQEKQDDFEL